MKVKIIKNLGDKSWNCYVDKIYEATKSRDGNYRVKTRPRFDETEWLKEEIEEVK